MKFKNKEVKAISIRFIANNEYDLAYLISTLSKFFKKKKVLWSEYVEINDIYEDGTVFDIKLKNTLEASIGLYIALYYLLRTDNPFPKTAYNISFGEWLTDEISSEYNSEMASSLDELKGL